MIAVSPPAGVRHERLPRCCWEERWRPGSWREGAPNRLKTLGWESAAGLVMGWLFLLALAQYYHNRDGTPDTPRS